MNLYTFRAVCTRVIDGDTIDCDIDVGFGLRTQQRLRLHGINTPELRTSSENERIRSKMAKQFVIDWMDGKEIFVQTYKSDVFGRYLARIYSDDVCLNDLLLKEGLAKIFMSEEDLTR